MSRTDLFARYTQVYAKTQAREVVPDGAFVRQLVDLPRGNLDIGVFFKPKKSKRAVQVYLGNPVPMDIAEEEGFLEDEETTYLSRTLISDMKTLDYCRVVISAGKVLTLKQDRIEFLKKAQRILDVILRKAKNVLYIGEFDHFRFDKYVRTLNEFLTKDLKMDDVSVEAAAIPFSVAAPEYILLSGNRIIVIGDEPKVPQAEFYLVGGIGYRFDKKEGALSEERLFRTTLDLSPQGIDEAYIDTMITRVTKDFQTNLHSLVFADVWKKTKARPIGINFGKDVLVKTESSSDIWMGVFEVYVKPPR
jgi:hypothetical protein